MVAVAHQGRGAPVAVGDGAHQRRRPQRRAVFAQRRNQALTGEGFAGGGGAHPAGQVFAAALGDGAAQGVGFGYAGQREGVVEQLLRAEPAARQIQPGVPGANVQIVQAGR
jgi:hypothetical protein